MIKFKNYRIAFTAVNARVSYYVLVHKPHVAGCGFSVLCSIPLFLRLGPI